MTQQLFFCMMQVTCYLDCEFFQKSYQEIQRCRIVYSFLKYNNILLEIYFLIQFISHMIYLLLFFVFAIVDSLVTPLESPKYVLSNSDVFYFCCLLIIYSHETGFNFQLLNCCVCVFVVESLISCNMRFCLLFLQFIHHHLNLPEKPFFSLRSERIFSMQ